MRGGWFPTDLPFERPDKRTQIEAKRDNAEHVELLVCLGSPRAPTFSSARLEGLEH